MDIATNWMPKKVSKEKVHFSPTVVNVPLSYVCIQKVCRIVSLENIFPELLIKVYIRQLLYVMYIVFGGTIHR